MLQANKERLYKLEKHFLSYQSRVYKAPKPPIAISPIHESV
jgi:hypothetical protein